MSVKKDWFSSASDDKATVYRQVEIVNKHTNEGKRMIAIAAASCVLYATATEDVTPATKLCECIGHGGDVLAKWFTTFGPFRFGKDKDGKNALLFGKREIEKFRNLLKEDKIAWATELIQNPYWVWSPPKSPFKPASIELLLQAAIGKVEKQLASEDLSDEDKAKVDAVGINQAKALLTQIRRMKIEADVASEATVAIAA
jgi:hypothetical protein